MTASKDKKIYKYYPSSAAFQWGNLTITPYNSGCVRYIVLSQLSELPREDIKLEYAEVGAAHEEWFAAQTPEHNFEREESHRFMLSENVQFSGRTDFRNDKGIVETKGTMNKSTRLNVIRKGIFSTSHLAQLVTYMIFLKYTKGKIVSGYYERPKGEPRGSFEHKEHRIFDVEITQQGVITVDGIDTDYHVKDLIAHQQAVTKAFEVDDLPERPDNTDNPDGFSSPCRYCPIKNYCQTADEHKLTRDETVKLIKMEEGL